MRGIYKITCKPNGKIYVGSSENIQKRWSRHRQMLKRNDHPNPNIQASWNKYGADAFSFEMILELSKEESLFDVEQTYLDSGDYEFNSAKIAGIGFRTGVKHTKDARAKMTAGQHRYWARRKANGQITHSEETKKKIAAAHIGMIHSDESKTRMSRSARARPYNGLTKRPVEQLKDGIVINEFESSHEAERATGICNQNIGKVASGKRPRAGGFEWRYKAI